MKPTAFKADGTPVYPSEEVAAPPVTFIDGRGFRNEALEPTGKTRLTQADHQTLVARHFERAEFRQATSNLNLARALALGAALRRRGEG